MIDTPSLNRLARKVAVVTGAASGIGEATARLFAHEGATVVAVDRPESAIMTAHLDVSRIVPLAVDVTDTGAPAAIVAAALAAGGGLDILFNNAGVSGRSLVADYPDALWDRQLAVNVSAMFRICRESIPHLRRRAAATGRARIVNTASVMAERTDLGLAGYVASKHAVAGLSRTLALELGKWGITVNYLLPGAILTGMTRDAFSDEHVRQVWEKKAALRRLGTPMDMARAVLLLVGDDADFITGHGLVADGGLTLRT
jgi:NAD(P)-dependent dehydrogenase (short-subunit alcohol dehydrogenase family)